MPLDRSFRDVTSATAAVATERFPLAIPPKNLERTNTQKSPAKIHRAYPKQVPPTVNINTGRLPILSESLPYGGKEEL